MAGWLRRTWRRVRDESPRRALRTSGHEAAAGTVGRVASGVYGRLAEPTAIWERDWDVLCLLDGCRLDLFREEVAAAEYDYLPATGGVDAIWSVGSQSAEWMARTFDDEYAEEMQRTAYVTGNPFSAQSGDQIVAVDTDPLPLDADDFGLLYEAWRDEWIDDEISTIPPDALTDAAIATWRRREELGVERVLVHYMQPHCPFRSQPDWFLGAAPTDDWGRLDEEARNGDPMTGAGRHPEAADGDTSPEAADGNATPEDSNSDEPIDLDEDEERELARLVAALEEEDSEAGRDPWTRVRDGELPRAEFWAAYRDNLRWVLGELSRLVENCDGRIAVTSDHGNGAGEFGVWSHPPAVHLPTLREVPWVEVEGEDRQTSEPALPERALSAEAGAGTHEAAATAEQRLIDLGYR